LGAEEFRRSDHLGGVFHQTADTIDGHDSMGFNFGAIYDFNTTTSCFRRVEALQNADKTNDFSWYVGFLLTGPSNEPLLPSHKRPVRTGTARTRARASPNYTVKGPIIRTLSASAKNNETGMRKDGGDHSSGGAPQSSNHEGGNNAAQQPRHELIGDLLLSRLQEAGVRHLFSVPGDYNLELLQQLQDTGTLKWIGTCSELNASYARTATRG
jgi:hypothetical protein